MSHHFERGRLLIEQGRWDLAEKELRAAVAEDPDSCFGHALLSIALRGGGRHEDALHEAEEAVRLAPDLSFCHYARARALDGMDRLKEAEAAILEAIRLDPLDADCRAIHASLLFQQHRWKESLDAAEAGLANDAENMSCVNLRAMALAKLGRKSESRAAAEGALALDPEDAFAHCVQGWNCLEQRDPRSALEYFRTALRLDPTLEYARQGIVEALKARHFVYRLLLQYFLWMARLSGAAQWGVVIGLYVAFKLLSQWLEASPELAPLLVPLLLLYLLFCILTWIAVPMFNLLLRLNRFGRYALSRDEIVASNWFGGFLATAAVAGVAGLALRSAPVLLFAGWNLLMVSPVALAMQSHKPAKRRLLCVCAAILGAVGLAALGLHVSGGAAQVQTLATVFFLGWVFFPWLSNLAG